MISKCYGTVCSCFEYVTLINMVEGFDHDLLITPLYSGWSILARLLLHTVLSLLSDWLENSNMFSIFSFECISVSVVVTRLINKIYQA